MNEKPLLGKSILITGAARRLGRVFALACANAGADIIIHHGHSEVDAQTLLEEVTSLGIKAHVIKADLRDPSQVLELANQANKTGTLYGLVNNAAVFGSSALENTTYEDWERHFAVNLTAPFLLSQAFAKESGAPIGKRIVNILDWRALRPGADHFAYTISKACLAALTKSLAVALAPDISVNGLALGAILPPYDQSSNPDILKNVPAERWGTSEEVQTALLFLLTGPAYITGEFISLDGGRHLI